MTTFYDNWLNLWDKSQAEIAAARRVIHEEEIEWVETPQDAKAGLLIAPETGFRTMGTVTMIAEIAPGWHTGTRKHGEEAIHFLGGSGFSIIDGRRYDWKKNSTMVVPFGAVHQHYNTSDEPVRYVSSLVPHLEYFCGIHRTTQIDPFGKIGTVPDVPLADRDGQYGPNGNRIVLHVEDALELIKNKEDGGGDAAPPPPMATEDGKPIVIEGGQLGMQAYVSQHKDQILRFMRIGKPTLDFDVHTIEMSGLNTDNPRKAGGTHAHNEAHLYIVEGSGYTIIDDVKYEWRPGSALHIPGPQTVHQHINDGYVPTKMLRIAPGVRYLFEPIAKHEFPYLWFGGSSPLPQEEQTGS